MFFSLTNFVHFLVSVLTSIPNELWHKNLIILCREEFSYFHGWLDVFLIVGSGVPEGRFFFYVEGSFSRLLSAAVFKSLNREKHWYHFLIQLADDSVMVHPKSDLSSFVFVFKRLSDSVYEKQFWLFLPIGKEIFS